MKRNRHEQHSLLLPIFPRSQNSRLQVLWIFLTILLPSGGGKRDLLFGNAAKICRSISELATIPATTDQSLDLLSAEAVHQLKAMFDSKFGGFGLAVKFPMPVYLLFLLSRKGNIFPEAHSMALRTLENIMKGGINDQIGGGFHRYTVDQQWIIPHLEKMLYDQALLIIAYCDAFAICHDDRFLETAVKTAQFTVNELLTESGGFCCGLDADSEGEEGLFYVWHYEELQGILGADGTAALAYWGASPNGDLDGRCILHQAIDRETIAAEQKISTAELQQIIANASVKLLSAREGRERPLRDTKAICSWNSLMITALSRLYKVSGDREWLTLAEDTAKFILSEMVNTRGRLVRSWMGTLSTIAAFAEDYVAFTTALAELAVNDPESLWEEKLAFFAGELVRLFINEAGDVFSCGNDTEQLPVNIPAIEDGVLPATAATCATALIQAGRICQNNAFIETRGKIIERYRGIVEKNPAACLSLIMAEEELSERYLRTDL